MNLESLLENARQYGDANAKLHSSYYQSPMPSGFDTLSCKYDAPLNNGTGVHVVIEFELVKPSGFFLRQNCGSELPVKKLIKKLRKTDNIADLKVYQIRTGRFLFV